jgi:type VI secretion system protein
MKNLFLLFFIFLANCETVSNYVFEDTDVEFIDELSLIGSKNMNNNKPLRVDFVIVKHPVVAQQVGRLSADQYMRSRSQLKQDYPKYIKFNSYELVPGQTVVKDLSYPKKDVVAAFIFADFDNENVNRWSVFSADLVVVKLLENTLQITSRNENEEEKIKPNKVAEDIVIIDKVPI